VPIWNQGLKHGFLIVACTAWQVLCSSKDSTIKKEACPMSIEQLCSQEVVCATPEDDLLTIAQLMRDRAVGDVVIVENLSDGLLPRGIVTDRDIVVRAVAEDVDLGDLTAGDIMNSRLAKVKKTDGIYETIQVLQREEVRRAIVVDEDNRLCGVVSTDDLVELLGDEIHRIGQLYRKQVENESKGPHSFFISL